MKLCDHLLSWSDFVTAIVTFMEPRALGTPVELLVKPGQSPFHVEILSGYYRNVNESRPANEYTYKPAKQLLSAAFLRNNSRRYGCFGRMTGNTEITRGDRLLPVCRQSTRNKDQPLLDERIGLLSSIKNQAQHSLSRRSRDLLQLQPSLKTCWES